MNALLKNLWIIPLVAVIFFRDKIFGIGGNNDGRGDLEERKITIGATISNAQAESLAEQFFDVMKDMGRSDAEDLLPLWEKIKNMADYNKVYNEFEKRQYSTFWHNIGDPWTSGKYDLTSWLNYETEEETRQKLKAANPQIAIFA